MVDILQKAGICQRLVLLLLWVHGGITGVLASKKVYFNEYGHCIKKEPFELKDDSYIAYSEGGGFDYRSTDCSLTFVAAPGYGVCISFDDFDIDDDCLVRLLVYKARDKDANVWKEFTCNSERPKQMCTSERYVTLRVNRLEVLEKGPFEYKFKIEIEQSSSITDEGMVFVSIGLVVGITVAVVVVVLLIIALVVYFRRKGDASSTKRAIAEDDQVQPSAPPLLENGEGRSTDPAMHLYPHLQLQQEIPMVEPPPPYELPPSYSPQNS